MTQPNDTGRSAGEDVENQFAVISVTADQPVLPQNEAQQLWHSALEGPIMWHKIVAVGAILLFFV